jgi:uncharacterized protein YggU (UPF0235/DUF167 family)
MPPERKYRITDAKSGAAFTVRVITRAINTEMAGVQEDGALKIRLKATPAGSAEANDELVGFLADQLMVSADQIEIVAGANGREKVIAVEGITTSDLENKLGVASEDQ